MRIDQLDDHILKAAYELFDEACLDLRVGRNLTKLRRRLARLTQLTDQLASK